MIEFKTGNIFDSKMQYITIPVNCGGVAGAGLAEQFKKRYPKSHDVYVQACKDKILSIGNPQFINTVNEKFLLFPTKDFWYNDSNLEYVRIGLSNITSGDILNSFCDSIAFPALGCGFGLLKWEDVKPIMIEYLSKLDIPIEIYEPCPERERNDRKYLKKIDRPSG